MLGWTQKKLADESGVSVPTIKRLELINGPMNVRLDTLTKFRNAFEAAGIQFIEKNGGGPGVRLKE